MVDKILSENAKSNALPTLIMARQTIPLIRRIAKITEKGKPRYIIRLPLELNHLWEPLYKTKKRIIVHIEVR